MVCALIASTGWAQQADWVSQICQSYQTNQYVAALIECSQNGSPDAYQSLSANTVKTAVIAIFVLSIAIVLIIFIMHIFLAFRRRKSWPIITRIVCIRYRLRLIRSLVYLDRCDIHSVISVGSIDFDCRDLLGSEIIDDIRFSLHIEFISIDTEWLSQSANRCSRCSSSSYQSSLTFVPCR